jgi:hypothetical protein
MERREKVNLVEDLQSLFEDLLKHHPVPKPKKGGYDVDSEEDLSRHTARERVRSIREGFELLRASI